MMAATTNKQEGENKRQQLLISQETKQAIISHKYSGNKSKEEYVVSDGASTLHVSPWAEIFTPNTLKKCSYSCQLGVGVAEASWMGTVEIQSQHDPSIIIELHDTLFMPDCPFFLLSEGKFDDASCKISKYNRAITIKYKDLQQIRASKIWLLGERMTWSNLYHVSLSFRYSSSQDLSIIQIVQAEEGTLKTSENNEGEHVANESKELANVDVNLFDACAQQESLRHDKTVVSSLRQTKTVVRSNTRTQPPKNVPTIPTAIMVLSPQELIHEHESGGHGGFNKIRTQHGMPVLPPAQLPKCRPCQIWNQKAAPISRKKKNKQTVSPTVTRVYQVISIDKAYMPVPTWDGEQWFQVIVDFLSRKVCKQRFKNKNQDFPAFEHHYKQIKAEKPNVKLQEVQCDNEYYKNNFIELGAQEGFIMSPKSAYTGKAWLAERMIGLLRRVTMPQLETASASIKDWGYSMDHAEVLLNKSHTACLPKNVTRDDVWLTEDRSDEFWSKQQGSVSQRKHQYERWGCLGALMIFLNNKSQPGSVDVMNLGFNKYLKDKYIVRVLKTGRITSSINVQFNSEIMPCASADFSQYTSVLNQKWDPVTPVDADGSATLFDDSNLLYFEKPTWQTPIFDNSDHTDRAQIANIRDGFGLETPVEPSQNKQLREGTRQREPTTKCVQNQVATIDSANFALLTKADFYPISNPVTNADAMQGEHKDEWAKARLFEMQEIWDTNTYELVPRPPKHIRVLGSRFIDKIKWRKRENFQLRSKAEDEAPLSNYIVDRFKSRWIALGWGLKKVYKNSYALVLSYDADRVYFCLAVYYRLLIYSEDFKNFFLVGSMIEEKDTFIEQAPGFKVKGKEDLVCLLKKSLYGIPPSPRIANEYLCDVLTNKANSSG